MTKKLSETTKQTYERSIKKFEAKGYKMDDLNMESIEEYLNLEKKSKSWENIILSAILQRINNDDLKKSISEKIKSNIKEMSYKRSCNKISKNKAENYIEWSNIKLIHEKMRELIELNNNDLYKDYLILSLYIYQPPRRVKDYIEMYLDEDKNIDITENILKIEADDDECIKYFENHNKLKHDEILSEKNYYIRRSGMFQFENYKTKTTYGKQIIEISKELIKILDEYIEKYGIKNGDNILNIKKSNYIKRLKLIFNRICERSPSATTIRQSYITNILRDETKSKNIRKYIGHKMAHSYEMQSEYRKQEDKNDTEELRKKIISQEITSLNNSIQVTRGRPKKYETEETKKNKKHERYNKNKLYIKEYNAKYYKNHKNT